MQGAMTVGWRNGYTSELAIIDDTANGALAALPAVPGYGSGRRAKSSAGGSGLNANDELAAKERLVMTLYYYENLTIKEVGVTLGAAESRILQIHSALLQLRAALAKLRPEATPEISLCGRAGL